MIAPPHDVERRLHAVADQLVAGAAPWSLLSPALFRIWSHGLAYATERGIAEQELLDRIEALNAECDRLYWEAQNPTPEARAAWAERRVAALAPDAMWQAENAIRAMVAERDENYSSVNERSAA